MKKRLVVCDDYVIKLLPNNSVRVEFTILIIVWQSQVFSHRNRSQTKISKLSRMQFKKYINKRRKTSRNNSMHYVAKLVFFRLPASHRASGVAFERTLAELVHFAQRRVRKLRLVILNHVHFVGHLQNVRHQIDQSFAVVRPPENPPTRHPAVPVGLGVVDRLAQNGRSDPVRVEDSLVEKQQSDVEHPRIRSAVLVALVAYKSVRGRRLLVRCVFAVPGVPASDHDLEFFGFYKVPSRGLPPDAVSGRQNPL